MSKESVLIKSSDGINSLNTLCWIPDGEIKAIVQISHGMIEYIDRYDDFAKFLCESNILVIGNDHLGHGGTAANDDDLGYFGEGRSKTVVDDLYEVTKYAKQTYGDSVPYILFGHSMGSFMARRYIMTYGNELTAAIICGTGYTPGAVLGAGKFVTNMVKLFKGERHRSTLLKNIAFGSYNKRIPNVKTANDWLSRNESNVEKYNKDKYCTFLFTANGYQTLFDVLTFIQKKSNVKNIPKNLPLFFIAGEEDPVGAYGKGVMRVVKQYRESGIFHIDAKLYPYDRHEILNEIDKDLVYEDVLEWIKTYC